MRQDDAVMRLCVGEQILIRMADECGLGHINNVPAPLAKQAIDGDPETLVDEEPGLLLSPLVAASASFVKTGNGNQGIKAPPSIDACFTRDCGEIESWE